MRVVVLSLLLTLGAIVAPAFAQSSLQENQKAVLVFDIRMDMLISSPLGKKMKFGELMSQAQKQSGQPGDPSKLVRIFGAVSAPESMAEVAGVQPGGELPVEFFGRAKYQDAASAKEAFDFAVQGNVEKVEKNGRTFYKAIEGDGSGMPPGLIMHQVDDTTLEIGTEAYVFHDDRKVFTDNLQTAWSKSPNEAIRISMDIKGAKGLIAELIEEGKKSAPNPTFEAYYDQIANISHMGISFDLAGKNLLSLRTTALDSEKAEELKGALDSLLFIAQEGGQSALPMIEGAMPEVKPVVESLLGSLVAKIDGADVSVIIPRPDGFEEAIEAAGKIVPMMMGFGAGPPPGGSGGPGGFGPGSGFDE